MYVTSPVQHPMFFINMCMNVVCISFKFHNPMYEICICEYTLCTRYRKNFSCERDSNNNNNKKFYLLMKGTKS